MHPQLSGDTFTWHITFSLCLSFTISPTGLNLNKAWSVALSSILAAPGTAAQCLVNALKWNNLKSELKLCTGSTVDLESGDFCSTSSVSRCLPSTWTSPNLGMQKRPSVPYKGKLEWYSLSLHLGHTGQGWDISLANWRLGLRTLTLKGVRETVETVSG